MRSSAFMSSILLLALCSPSFAQYPTSLDQFCGGGPPSGNLPLASPNIEGDAVAKLLWNTFIAMNWPADTSAGRGVPLNPDNPLEFGRLRRGPRVWETWKQSFELFQPDPSSWDSYELQIPPCQEIETLDGERIEVTAENWPQLYRNNGGTVLNLVNLVKQAPKYPSESLSVVPTGPLIDQNQEYQYYEVRFNQELYDCAGHGVGRRCINEPKRLNLPPNTDEFTGAISAKASWRKATKTSNPWYYGKNVMILVYEQGADDEPPKSVCKVEHRLLVGLHIVYKDAFVPIDRVVENTETLYGYTDGGISKNNWLWGTFEGPANAPECPNSFYSLSPHGGFSYEPEPLGREPLPPISSRHPVMTCSVFNPAPDSAVGVNNRVCRQSLPNPWHNYQMANDQWLLDGIPSRTNNVANVNLETYVQRDTCMTCHQFESTPFDFVWTIALDRLGVLPKFNYNYYPNKQ